MAVDACVASCEFITNSSLLSHHKYAVVIARASRRDEGRGGDLVTPTPLIMGEPKPSKPDTLK